MRTAAKIAVSIPRATLASIEKERRRAKRSRSAVVTEALEEWLRARSPDDRESRYVEAYLRTPERIDETAAVAESAAAVWEPWE